MASVQESLKFLVLSASALALRSSALSTPLIVLAFCQAGLLLESLFKIEAAAVSEKQAKKADSSATSLPLRLEKCFSRAASWVAEAPYVTVVAFMVVVAQLYVIMLQKNEIQVFDNLLAVGIGFLIRAIVAFGLVFLLESYLRQGQIQAAEVEEEEEAAEDLSCGECGKDCGASSWDGCPYNEGYWADVMRCPETSNADKTAMEVWQ
eukprot:TRINITY_DN1001_c0_g2_i2.p1 TRINITY_DN1001_c0_g2~~TRINITY_DN1001_c0_g2_i2.p1  ORF type:complete len:207 (-),score=50.18 TRINITY_DN1001_c0_g2_i2:165-785(-)